jgi:hypothetical protein
LSRSMMLVAPSSEAEGVISAVLAELNSESAVDAVVEVDWLDSRSACLAHVGRRGGGRNADGMPLRTRRTWSRDVDVHSSSSDSLPDHPFPLVRPTPERSEAMDTDDARRVL